MANHHPSPRLWHVVAPLEESQGCSTSFEYDYVDATSISEHLVCPVCLLPATQPVINQCGHLFCKPCLQRWRSTCPLCRADLTPDACCDAARPVASLLDDLIVRCVHCNAVMRRAVMDRHQLVRGCSSTQSAITNFHLDQQAKRTHGILPGKSYGSEQLCPGAAYGCLFEGSSDGLELHLLDCPTFRALPLLRMQAQQVAETHTQLATAKEQVLHLQRQLQQLQQSLRLQSPLVAAPSAAASFMSTPPPLEANEPAQSFGGQRRAIALASHQIDLRLQREPWLPRSYAEQLCDRCSVM